MVIFLFFKIPLAAMKKMAWKQAREELDRMVRSLCWKIMEYNDRMMTEL